MIVIIDNYDSFTYNLVQRLGEIDAALDIRVFRNDATSPAEVLGLAPSHVIISPGPCTPTEAGVSLQIADEMSGKVPLLGVCLGHQSIGQATGGKIVRAKRLMHGKTDEIHHDGKGLFADLPNPMIATRYHSLVIEPSTLSSDFVVSAWSDAPDGTREIMAIRHRSLPVFGLQFSSGELSVRPRPHVARTIPASAAFQLGTVSQIAIRMSHWAPPGDLFRIEVRVALATREPCSPTYV